ncbi:MAG: hypothetical protein ACJ79L_06605 [Anaeromyxobacteraceae bacterium]
MLVAPAFDAAGNLYVATRPDAVAKVDPTGRLLWTSRLAAPADGGPPELVLAPTPRRLYALARGALAVLDAADGQVVARQDAPLAVDVAADDGGRAFLVGADRGECHEVALTTLGDDGAGTAAARTLTSHRSCIAGPRAGVAAAAGGTVAIAGTFDTASDLGAGEVAPHGGSDAFVIATPAAGQGGVAPLERVPRLKRRWSAAVAGEVLAVAAGSRGEAFIAARSPALLRQDLVVEKRDASGAVLWSRRFGDARHFAASGRALAATPDGGAVLALAWDCFEPAQGPCGTVLEAGAGPVPHGALLAFAADGAVRWQVAVPNTGTNPNAIAVDATGRIAAHVSSTVQVYSPDGKLLWTVPDEADLGAAPAFDASGALYVQFLDPVAGASFRNLGKYDATGHRIWRAATERLGGDVSVAPGGEVVLSSGREAVVLGGADGHLVRTLDLPLDGAHTSLDGAGALYGTGPGAGCGALAVGRFALDGALLASHELRDVACDGRAATRAASLSATPGGDVIVGASSVFGAPVEVAPGVVVEPGPPGGFVVVLGP